MRPNLESKPIINTDFAWLRVYPPFLHESALIHDRTSIK